MEDLDDWVGLSCKADEYRREAEYYETYEPDDKASINTCWYKYAKLDELANTLKFSTCSSCGTVSEEVVDRYSAGIYAGRLCIKCCGKYRDNCGVNGEEPTPVEELDEFAYGGYDAVYGEEGGIL